MGRQQSGSVAESTPDLTSRMMELLRKYQGMGRQQEVAGQQEQVKRVFSTNADLIGASPAIQNQVRGAATEAIDPTIGGARSLVSEAKSLLTEYQQTEEKNQGRAQKLVEAAISSGSVGLRELLATSPDVFKKAGYDTKSFEAVAKGLEAQEVAKKKETDGDGTISEFRLETGKRILDSTADLEGRVNNKTVGLGFLARKFPSVEARNFAADLSTLTSNIAQTTLQQMREASKTGGALGQVSERELDLLESSLGALDQGQTPENFKKNLKKVEDNVRRWDKTLAAYSRGQNIGGQTIRVRQKSTGKTGSIPVNEFNPNLYDKI